MLSEDKINVIDEDSTIYFLKLNQDEIKELLKLRGNKEKINRRLFVIMQVKRYDLIISLFFYCNFLRIML